MKENQTMKNRNILISGASIAGPALAFWLNRYGFATTIIEKAPSLREGGHAIDIRGTSREVAERMGIMPQIRQNTSKTRGMTFVNSRNQPRATLTVEDFKGEGPISEFEILRGDLAQILYDSTRNETEYIFDDSITAIAEDGEGLLVSFNRGQPRRFDLVIGADGFHSNVRRLVFGEEAQFVRYLGYSLAIFTYRSHLELNQQLLAYSIPGKVVTIYPTRHPGQAKASFNFSAPPRPYDHRDIEQQKQVVAETFADAGWEVPRLLEEMGKATDFYFDTLGLVQMENWSKGRVALLGDAAYCPSPITGQGTNLALVGAYVLAGELKTAMGDYRAAFAAYQREMRDYVEENQKTVERNARGFVPATKFQIWWRNTNLRLLTKMPWKNFVIKIMMKEIAIKLKDYESSPTPARPDPTPVH